MGYPIPGTVTHSLMHGFRNVLSIALATDIGFKEADQIKAILSDPEAMAKLQASATVAEEKQDDVIVADEPDAAADSDSSDSSGGGIGDLFGGMD